METIREIILFAREHKKFWVLPFFLVLALLGALAAVTQGSAISPFIYALF